jgi:outer membrane murein-binding lipoprotein Lpp
MLYTLIIIGALVIVGLAYYAGQLLWQVQEQKKRQLAEKERKLNYITDSIRHIVKAMISKQCEYSEGVLRIWVLLDHYNKEQAEPKDYPALYPGFASLYEVIKDMPTHEARKRLSKQDRMKMDMERWKAENEFESQIDLDLIELKAEFPS